jgi:hypothetical protein
MSSRDHEQGEGKPAAQGWSRIRRRFASGVASVLYGVIAIMSAELTYRPGMASRYAVAAGALLVGFAMSLTHLFVELVNTETRHGAHVRGREAGELLRSSLLVMAFPAGVAALVLVAQFLGLEPGALAHLLPYISVATVLVLGFGSSFILDRRPLPALTRGITWTLLSLVLFLAKLMMP